MLRPCTASAFAAILLLTRCGEAERLLPIAGERDCERPAASPVLAVEPTPATVPMANAQAAIPALAAPGVPDLSDVRCLVAALGGVECKSLEWHRNRDRSLEELRRLGPTVYPIYEQILADPRSTVRAIDGLFIAIDELRIDSRPYIPLAVKRLTEPHVGVADEAVWRDDDREWCRMFLIEFLKCEGDERCSWVLIQQLSINDQRTPERAARALVRIGGQRELEAFNRWLIEQNPNEPQFNAFRKCRDQLEQRLLAERAKKPF